MSVDYIARVIEGIEITEKEYDEIEESGVNCSPFNIYSTEYGYYFGRSLSRIDLNYQPDQIITPKGYVWNDIWAVAEPLVLKIEVSE
jgi:hypothetical protein